jgi:hypothetical protein
MRVSPSYLRTKAGRWGRSRNELGIEPFGGAQAAGNAPTATGTPNSVAVFDVNGLLIGSSDINLDLLEYLIGTQAASSEVVDDDTTEAIDEFDASQYKTAQVQYVVKRGASFRGGFFIITTDGSTVRTADYSTTEIGDTGVDFSADLNAGNFRVLATTDAQGVSATVYYKVSLV